MAGFSRSSMVTYLVFVAQIGDATAAQARVTGVSVDVFAVMPAALAIFRRARRDEHAVGLGCDDARLRSEQHEAQVVAQGCQLGLGGGAGMQRDLGLLRGTDAACDSHGFQFLLRLGTYSADAGPALELVRFLGLCRQRVPGVQEQRAVLACQ